MPVKRDESSNVLWTPSHEMVVESHIYDFMTSVNKSSYVDLWKWSVDDLDGFWGSVWNYFSLGDHGEVVLQNRRMPGAEWFPGTTLNYAQHLLARFTDPEAPLISFTDERGPTKTWCVRQVSEMAGGLGHTLRKWGIRPGDRVAAYLPNVPEAVVAFIASVSIGAIWSICSPDFGLLSVTDRFRQIEPKVLLVTDGYRYKGVAHDRRGIGQAMVEALPTVTHVIEVPNLAEDTKAERWISGVESITWNEACRDRAALRFEPLPFDHPLWILYSSGTTGLPKAIVHGHGGMLLAHLVTDFFHFDLHPGDRFFWFSTTGWMMWNIVVSALLAGSHIMLYDGDPTYPEMDRLWRWASEERFTLFGTGAAYLHGQQKAGIIPRQRYDLSSLVALGSTGSPLNPEAYDWVYNAVKPDIWLAPASGGTDVCSPFVGGCPLLPVRRGVMQCRVLGARVESFDPTGRSLVNETGELVVTAPMPGMPLYFWGDHNFERYRSSYFEMFPGVWRHGDWLRLNSDGEAVILGRSDATINRYGVRMGSSDIYRAVQGTQGVQDSLVVDLEGLHGNSFMPLFVQLEPGVTWSNALQTTIRKAIQSALSPRHLPDVIIPVSDIPRTLNGKKLEVPIRRILQGQSVQEAVDPDAMVNPDSLHAFVEYAQRLRARSGKRGD